MSTQQSVMDIDRLSTMDKLALIDRLWASIAAEDSAFSLTAEQELELNKRLQEYESSPDNTVPWQTILEESKERLSR